MRLQEYLRAPDTAAPFRSSAFSDSKIRSTTAKRLTIFALALFLLPLGTRALFAQAPPEPDANMDQPYNPNAQYDPGQQSYSQPQPQSYAQPQPQYDSQLQSQPYSSYDQQPAYSQPQMPSQAMSADQLEQLVAPIALYPDALIAQILSASTYPDQVADADRWRQAQGYASPDQIAAGASVQSWDASVKALTAFPQVLSNMDANLAWTAALGNAFYNQPQDVFQAIQIMRQRAQSAGSLQSTPQQLVNNDQGYVQIVPANPQVVYVPAYNPWTVYGQPVTPYPGFSFFGALATFLDSSTLRFGIGMAMSAFSHTPWGWLGWGLNWLTQNVLFNQSNYYSHSTSVRDWGLPNGGPRYIGHPSYAHNYGYPSRGYNQGLRPQNAYAGSWPRENYNRGYQSSTFNNYRPNNYRSAPQSPGLQGWNRPPASIRPQPYQNYSRPAYGSVFNHSYGSTYNSTYSARPGQTYNNSFQAYNHNPAPITRPQTYAPNYRHSYIRPTYNSGFNRPTVYSPRPAQSYGNSFQSYRAPSSAYGNGFMNSSIKPQHSGGFHPFGSHNSGNFYGGHAPKSFKPEKSFGGGHSGGFHPFGGGHGGGGGHHRL